MVKFANGKTIETIGNYGERMDFQNAQRETLEFRVARDAATFDELRGIYLNPDALREIQITVDEPLPPVSVEPDAGTLEFFESKVVQSLHLNFTLPVRLALEDVDGEQVWCMKVAQKSELELAQEQQAADINDTQLALIEIATMIGG